MTHRANRPTRARYWSQRTDLAVAALLAAWAFVGPADLRAQEQTEGFVFSVNHDGRLISASQSQDFQRTYSSRERDGRLRQGDRLFLFSQGAAENVDAQVAPSRSVPVRADILQAIEDTALRYAGHAGLRRAGLSVSDWTLLYRANIEIESAYDPRATSHVGAIGLGQLMPDTARDLGVNAHDPLENLDGSARYLLMMLDRFGDSRLALAAYNAGPEAVTRHGGIPPYEETRGHVAKVTTAVRRLKGDLS